MSATEPVRNSTLRSWATRGCIGIIDQASFAGSNFILNVLLARWMLPNEYGAFALANSFYLYIFTVYSATFTDPLLVFGASRYGASKSGYMRRVCEGHALFCLATLIIFCVSAEFIGSAPLKESALGFGLAAPVALTIWLFRRACYAFLSPAVSLRGGLVYFLLLLISSYLARRLGILNAFTAPLILVIAGATGALVILPSIPLGRAGPYPAVLDVFKAHWRFGRWSAGAAIFAWVPGNIGIVLLSAASNLAGSGAYRATMVLLLPLAQVMAALVPTYVPFLVRHRDHPSFHLYIFWCVGGATLVGVVYAAILIIGGPQLFEAIYLGKYPESLSAIKPLAISAPFYAACVAMTGVLQSLERPDRSFYSALVTAIVMSVVSIPMIHYDGIRGAAIGWLSGTIISAMCLAVLSWQALKTHLLEASHGYAHALVDEERIERIDTPAV